MDTTPARAAALVSLAAAARAWCARWRVDPQLLRRLLPGLAAAQSGEIPDHSGALGARWRELTTAQVQRLVASLEYSLAQDETTTDAADRLVGWCKVAELVVAASDLRPLEGDCPGWARVAARDIAADIARLKRRDVQRAAGLARAAA